jgi:K+-sensing histidine kinase KdpD
MPAPEKAIEMLCSNLAFGIHAAAQPLAVLQASLNREHTDRMSAGELRQLVASSGSEVQRICAIFHCLQQLVMAESEPQLEALPIEPVITDAIDGVSLLFQNDDIVLTVQTAETLPLVRAHRSRTLHALSRVLLAAHALSARDGAVEVTASRTERGIRVEIRNVNASPYKVSAEMRLSLAIAAANIRSQGASFFHRLHPFEVRIELPEAGLAC